MTTHMPGNSPDFYKIAEQLGEFRESLRVLGVQLTDMRTETRGVVSALHELVNYTHDLKHEFANHKMTMDEKVPRLSQQVKETSKNTEQNGHKLDVALAEIELIQQRVVKIEEPVNELVMTRKRLLWTGGFLLTAITVVSFILSPLYTHIADRFLESNFTWMK